MAMQAEVRRQHDDYQRLDRRVHDVHAADRPAADPAGAVHPRAASGSVCVTG